VSPPQRNKTLTENVWFEPVTLDLTNPVFFLAKMHSSAPHPDSYLLDEKALSELISRYRMQGLHLHLPISLTAVAFGQTCCCTPNFITTDASINQWIASNECPRSYYVRRKQRGSRQELEWTLQWLWHVNYWISIYCTDKTPPCFVIEGPYLRSRIINWQLIRNNYITSHSRL
jgi:hypothetical protein